jgi:hypothetical protein
MTKYPDTVDGLPFVENWGSYNVYGTEDRAQVVDWQTGQVCPTDDGATDMFHVKQWAERLHRIHDIGNR